MVDQQELVASGVATGGREPAFDAIARTAARALGARAAALAVGDTPIIIGASTAALDPSVVSVALHGDILASGMPATAVDALSVPVRSPTGRPLGTLTVRADARVWSPDDLAALGDIARSAEAVLALRAARRPADPELARVLEAISDAVVFLDRGWRYTYVNRKAAAIFGRDPQDLIGRHIWTEFPEGVGQPFHRTYERAMAEQQSMSIESYYPPWNRWFENRIYPCADGICILFTDVTEERSRELDRRRLLAMLEVTPDLVVVAGADGRVTYRNATARRRFGDDELSLVAMHAPHAITQLTDHAIATALRTGVWRGESALAGDPAAPVLEILLYQPGSPPDGASLCLLAHDISEQKRAELELRRAADVRAQVERMAHLGFWQWHVATNRVTWSDELYRIYGVAGSGIEPSFEGYLARVHPGDRARVEATITGALRDRAAVTFEERVVRPDGQIRHLHSWGSVVVDAAGQPVEMFGACIDMTPLIETADGLRRTEEWLSLALDGACIGLWDWDVDNDRLSWSHDEQLVHGFAGSLGASLPGYLDHVPEPDRGAVAAAFQAAAEGRALDLEHRLRLPDGSMRWLALRGRAFAGAGGAAPRVAGSAIDITERRRGEDEQRGIVEQLRHAQKMEAIGRLAAGVAHDLNNLLTVISGSAQLMSRPPAARDDEHIELIEAATERAATMTRQLLALSRQQVFELAVLDVSAVVTAMSALLQRLFPPTIELRTELGAARAVRGDRSQLEQVVLNLAVNARDAMPGGGTLTIATRDEDDDVVIEVRDTGVGMSPEVRARIFEPFFTTKDESRGTGLGLAMVYGIVAQSGGRVDVTTAPGAGSAFAVHLPAIDGAAEPPPPPSPPAARASESGETILLVEDDHAVRAVVTAILEESQYRVIPARDAEDALAAIADTRDSIDLLLADVHLPQMSGVELARQIRATHPAMKILFMSGRRDDGDGALPGPVVEKPFGVEALASRVRRVLDEP